MSFSTNEVPKEDIKQEISKTVWEYVSKSPPIIILVVASYLIGHIWIYLIYAFYISEARRRQTVGRNIINSHWGKLAIGFLWTGIIIYIVSIIKYGNFYVEDYTKLISVIFAGVFVALVVQFLLAVITIMIGRIKK